MFLRLLSSRLLSIKGIILTITLYIYVSLYISIRLLIPGTFEVSKFVIPLLLKLLSTDMNTKTTYTIKSYISSSMLSEAKCCNDAVVSSL